MLTCFTSMAVAKGFKRVVVETVQRRHQTQIFRNALRNGLRQSMILHGQRNVTAQQSQRVEFAVFVKRIAGAAPQGDHSRQPSSSF